MLNRREDALGILNEETSVTFGMLLMTASAANAGGLVTKHASSVQLTVDAAFNCFKNWIFLHIAGSNVDTTDGSTANTFLLVLLPLVFTVQELLLQPKIPQVQHFLSVNLIHRVMHYLLVLQLKVQFLTLVQLLLTHWNW